jgi:hypothetical protein
MVVAMARVTASFPIYLESLQICETWWNRSKCVQTACCNTEAYHKIHLQAIELLKASTNSTFSKRRRAKGKCLQWLK